MLAFCWEVLLKKNRFMRHESIHELIVYYITIHNVKWIVIHESQYLRFDSALFQWPFCSIHARPRQAWWHFVSRAWSWSAEQKKGHGPRKSVRGTTATFGRQAPIVGSEILEWINWATTLHFPICLRKLGNKQKRLLSFIVPLLWKGKEIVHM